jgi:hypothetical protein
MYRFEYRMPRYRANLPVRLKLEKSTLTGRCREISKEGMTIDFPECPGPDSRGTIQFIYKDIAFQAEVCVAHSEATTCGLRFLSESAADRMAIDRLIASLRGPVSDAGPYLVK